MGVNLTTQSSLLEILWTRSIQISVLGVSVEYMCIQFYMSCPGGVSHKEPTCQGDVINESSTPESGRSPGAGNGTHRFVQMEPWSIYYFVTCCSYPMCLGYI